MPNSEQPEGRDNGARPPSLAARGERRRIERRLQEALLLAQLFQLGEARVDRRTRARVGAETGQLSALSPYEAPDSVFAVLDADRWGSESRWRRISITPMTTDREKLLSPL